jgi:cyclopropane fatty-acyl-phospholipid synthase-like methyltransferase
MPYTAREHWDAQYRKPGAAPWELTDAPSECALFLAQLSPGSRVLDVGCGRGVHSTWLMEAGHSVTAIDLSYVAVRAAGQRSGGRGAGGTVFLVGDVVNLPFREVPLFDGVYDYSVLHHLAVGTRSAYVTRLSRIVHPDGVVVMVCYSDEDQRASANVPRRGQLENPIYHLGRADLTALYAAHFESVEISPTRLGPSGQHPAFVVVCHGPRGA